MSAARILLIGYLSLVTLAGPWFCCCASASALAFLTPRQQEHESEEEEAVPFCCCCQPTSPEDTSTQQASPCHGQQPSPNSPSCPCRQRQHDSPAVPTQPTRLVDDGAPRLSPDSPAPADVLLCGFAGVGVHEARPATAENAALPFLSAQDLRCACHILHC
jgi:hypothetical protein